MPDTMPHRNTWVNANEVGIGTEDNVSPAEQKYAEFTIRPERYLHVGGNCIATCSLQTTVTLKNIS